MDPFRYRLVVDKCQDSEENVVKPLGRHMKGCEGYTGATIIGDGKVALILDVASLARMANLTTLGDARSGFPSPTYSPKGLLQR